MQRRNLVIIRAGNSSLHGAWLPPEGGERSWDLVVSYFGDDPQMHRRPDVVRIDGKGSKWAGLHALLTSGQLDWRAYERIWLPDDDLAATPQAIERLFMMAEYHELQLCQPSLSHDSYISHATTAHNPRCLLRRVNFTEIMAPLLTRDLLDRVLPTLIENESGWGLDYLWHMYLDRPREDAAVIDAVQVRHTRPVGGPNYARLREQGKSPYDELNALLHKYCLHDRAPLCWSAVLTDGTELFTDREEDTMRLLGLVLDGMRPWQNQAEVADVIGGHLRQSTTLRRVASRLQQQPAAAA